jgi:hypothetical protein
MMHPFHDYVAGKIARKLRGRRVVCFYDPRREFEPFIEELEPHDGDEGLPVVRIGDQQAALARFSDSFFAVRAAVEPVVRHDQPSPLMLYLPGVHRDRSGSVLMELDLGGDCFDQPLRGLARNALRDRFTDGEIDKMLAPKGLSYADVVGFLEGGGGAPSSVLKLLFPNHDSIRLLASWIADDARDAQIQAKGASDELRDLIEMRLGLSTDPDASLAELRARTLRHVLVHEFRSDLACDVPTTLSMIPAPSNSAQQDRCTQVARALRERHGAEYEALADQVEAELGLASAGLDPAALGVIDTFRFEERQLLAHCGDRIVAGDHGGALEVVEARHRSFWVDRDVDRQSQWEALRRLAELGQRIDAVRKAMGKVGVSPSSWVRAYADDGGWHELDRGYRQLESHIALMTDDPEAEQALGLVRKGYETLLRKMADGFSRAFQDADWTIDDILHQTQIYPDAVEGQPGKVAYLLVDAMRYEMGAELARHLDSAQDVSLRPAVTALPSITPVGMAALLPGASASFSVVESQGHPAARIGSTDLLGSKERTDYFKAQRPDSVDLTLGDLLGKTVSKARKAIGNANLVVVRSQEIDAVGETGDGLLFRQATAVLVGNLAKAIKKLARAGVERFVVTADHGHQFSLRKGEDMRTDNPGGAKVAVHRRCWIGRGGTTPPGTVRLQAADLSYESDLEFVFPLGLGVFKAGGGLRFHHGGFSLQELIVPVLSLRMPAPETEQPTGIQVTVEDYPPEITNRMLSIRVCVQGDLFHQAPVVLRPVLVSGGEQVGHAGMAPGVDYDHATACIAVPPGVEASVGMMLTNDGCGSLRIVIQDPTTDAVLFQTAELPVNLGI